MTWRLLSPSLIVLVLAAPIYALDIEPLEESTSECVRFSGRTDLDLDGRPDQIRVAFFDFGDMYYDRFVIEVNGQSLVSGGEGLDRKVRIVDIDSTDRFLEIVISESGPSDDYAATFFRYSQGSLRAIGTIPAPWDGVVVDGSGEIKSACRGSLLHTWFHPCRYRSQEWDGALKLVPQNLWEMDSPVTLKIDLPVLKSNREDEYEVAGVIKIGEHAVIVASDDQRWCFIRGESGVEEWFEMAGGKIMPGQRSGYDVFDGLVFAD